ncbi:MAG TPA: hypothetical protein VHZ03_05495 [Trebonia sp.]|nr:hypothetical protein [Trebonia sp.]
MIAGVTEITHITTKQDMSRWVRAHADVPGIKWSVQPGPGGTMIIVEYAEDRGSLNMANVSPDVAAPVASPVESADIVRASA